MSIGTRTVLALGLVGLASSGRGAEFPAFRGQEIDPKVGNVCYAVTTADVDGDGKLDVVAVTEDAVVWFGNPGWKKHTVIKDATARDNVCLQAHDIDGDGKVDFALGAGWKPTDTNGGGTLQWLKRTGDGDGDAPWKVLPLGSEPTLHRLRWGDVRGTGKKQLVVAPLQGRGTKGPDWGEGRGGARSWSTPSPTTPRAAPGRSRSPTTPCTRSTTSSSSTSTATAGTTSCSPRGKGSSSSRATRTAAGRRPSSARATRRRSRSRARAR